jgi:hypothetical protein
MVYQWTKEAEEEILSGLMDGKGLGDICGPDRDDWLPSERTVYRRISEDPEFWHRYARAREVQAHRETEEIRAIADAATSEDYNVARLKIDARKWRASKLAPKVYGDKVAIGGASDLPPIQTEDVSAAAIIEARLDEIASRTTGDTSEG